MKVFSVLLIIVFSFTTNIFSQVEFTPHTIAGGVFSNENRANSVYAVDIDRDGDIDVLSASYSVDPLITGGEIAWYENDGNENFTTHIFTTTHRALSVYAVDVDSDGDIDVVFAGGSVIAWYENDGNENFTPHTITTNAHISAHSVYAVDIDSDGDMDVLSGDKGYIDWYENDGNENFTSHRITGEFGGEGDWSVYAVDVDDDGDIDVLGATNDWEVIEWYENDDNENFTLNYITMNAGFLGNSVYAIDVDGDGDIDMLFAGGSVIPWNESVIAWYENDGNENFTPHTIAGFVTSTTSLYS